MLLKIIATACMLGMLYELLMNGYNRVGAVVILLLSVPVLLAV